MVRVGLFGAAGEVTGSNFFIETDEHRYVVDCGLFQGADTFTENNTEPFAYEVEKVEAVVITHAHLDHIGRLPKLVKEGFRGPIYLTEATAELTQLVLTDALNLMERKSEHENTPMLYDQTDLHRAISQFKPVAYRETHKLSGNDTFTLYDAGHILGSATALLEVGDKRLVFSGDIGHFPGTLLPKPETPDLADAVFIEATYGGQDRPNGKNKVEVVREALEWTIQNHGVLLIPAFSIERSQELLYIFHELFHKQNMPKIPIFLDSPLAIEALEVFERHRELFSGDVRREHPQSDDLFDFRGLVLAATVEDSKEINEQAPPKVIIAGSGMMVGGRITHHLIRYLDRDDTCLLIIGYQAPGTLGDRIVHNHGEVTVMRSLMAVRAHIIQSESFSGHADNSELLDWLKRIRLSGDKKVIIVHSDPKRAAVFEKELNSLLSQASVEVAHHGEVVEI